jgi:hypothetical protein
LIKLVIIFLIVIFFVKIPSYVEIVLFHYKAKTNIFALFVIILFLYIIKTFIQKIIHLFRSKFWKTSYTKNLLFIVDFDDNESTYGLYKKQLAPKIPINLNQFITINPKWMIGNRCH